MDTTDFQDIVVITGPTGSGKSELAIRLAQEIDGEIISVDSMQVYRGMDIGTAKVPGDQRLGVPHHLIDVADPDTEFDAGQFVRMAGRVLVDIRDRGRVPVFCGGTGLYLKAFFCGIGSAPPANPGLRRELESLTLEELRHQLAAISPGSLDHIDIHNKRRVVRALEVARLTGRSPSETWSPWKENIRKWPEQTFVLGRDVTKLKEKLDQRVTTMIRDGLIDETRQLLERGLLENTTARQAIGYRQAIAHLRESVSLEDTVGEIRVRTRQYAKRQRTWFRNQMPSTPVPADDPDEALAVILDHLKSSADFTRRLPA